MFTLILGAEVITLIDEIRSLKEQVSDFEASTKELTAQIADLERSVESEVAFQRGSIEGLDSTSTKVRIGVTVLTALLVMVVGYFYITGGDPGNLGDHLSDIVDGLDDVKTNLDSAITRTGSLEESVSGLGSHMSEVAKAVTEGVSKMARVHSGLSPTNSGDSSELGSPFGE